MTTMADKYQNRLIDQSCDSLDNGRNAFIVAPTGAGKSRTFSEIASERVQRDQRVIVMAQRQSLVLQAQENMDRWSRVPVDTSIGMDGQIDQGGQVVYTTVQSAHDLREHLDHYDVAIIDEAHHAKKANLEYSETMDALERKNPNIRFVAVSATPPEGYKGLDPRLVAADKHHMTFAEAIEARLIDLPETITPTLVLNENQNVREIVDRHRKDGKSAKLEGGISTELGKARPHDWAHQLVGLYDRKLSDRRTLAFFDSIKEAMAFTAEATDAGHKVDIVHSRRGLDANERTLQDFRDGKTKLLVSVDMISEGIDLDADGILLDKKTTSGDEYRQIIGRESRSHGVERERKALLVDTGASTYMHGDIASLASLQTARGELERRTLGPADFMPGVNRDGFNPWIEMSIDGEKSSKAYGTSVDGAIVYAVPNGDNYVAFRSTTGRKGSQFEMMQIGQERKGMTSKSSLGEWICDAVQRNEKALASLAGNTRDGASELKRMVEQDWSKHRNTIQRTLEMIAAPIVAAQQQMQQRMAYTR